MTDENDKTRYLNISFKEEDKKKEGRILHKGDILFCQLIRNIWKECIDIENIPVRVNKRERRIKELNTNNRVENRVEILLDIFHRTSK